MRNLLLTICYDGSTLHGWQVQENAVTVQEKLQDAIEKVFGRRESVTGCSRTDSGVHARMYCCNFRTEKDLPEEKVPLALNTYLPQEIAVLTCREVPLEFHARYHCRGKQYVYEVYNGRVRNPFTRRYAYHYKYPIDEALLQEQAQAYVGTYDYKGFCSSGSKVGHTVRTVSSFTVHRKGEMVYFTVEADGFLYNMVRIMVGTLLFINQGRIPKDTLKDIILSGERSRGGKTAPACGLYLNRVYYQTKEVGQDGTAAPGNRPAEKTDAAPAANSAAAPTPAAGRAENQKEGPQEG